MSTKNRILIVIEGGMLQTISSNFDVEIAIVDYDDNDKVRFINPDIKVEKENEFSTSDKIWIKPLFKREYKMKNQLKKNNW